jgi:hypothetical protein
MKARIEETLSRILSRKHRVKIKIKFKEKRSNGNYGTRRNFKQK